jgi:hypothetical protein
MAVTGSATGSVTGEVLGAALAVIPVCFGLLHLLEFSGTMARLAGLRSATPMLGQAIQQAVYIGTRFCIMLMLPLLGLLIDSGVARAAYQRMAVLCLLAAAGASCLALLHQDRVVAYYQAVMQRYQGGRSFLGAFWLVPPRPCQARQPLWPRLRRALAHPAGRRMIVQSAVVFALYATGILVAFHAALIHADYRAAISQLSGVINALGAVILTFHIEPRISRAVDTRPEEAETLVHCLLLGRLIGVAILGQIVLFLAFRGI